MDKEVFGGVADARTLALGVFNDAFGKIEISVLVHIDIAYALVVFDDGYAGVFRDKADESFTTAGDNAVDEFVEPEEDVEGFAVGGGDELYSFSR